MKENEMFGTEQLQQERLHIAQMATQLVCACLNEVDITHVSTDRRQRVIETAVDMAYNIAAQTAFKIHNELKAFKGKY